MCCALWASIPAIGACVYGARAPKQCYLSFYPFYLSRAATYRDVGMTYIEHHDTCIIMCMRSSCT